MRNGLRDRVAVRTDGGLQTGRDVLVAALLGAEEYGFGTAAARGARLRHGAPVPSRHLPDRHRDAARGPARQVHRHARGCRAVLHGDRRGRPPRARRHRARGHWRRSSAAADLLSVATGPRADARPGRPARRARLAGVADASLGSGTCPARGRARAGRADRGRARRRLRAPGARRRRRARPVASSTPTTRSRSDPYEALAKITTAERSFGAHISGLIERGIIRRPVRWTLEGSAGQSFGAFSNESVELVLIGQANDYVGKGLSGGTVILRPEASIADRAADLAIAGNTCLYGATGGRMHVVGRAGMRFAVRNSGAVAVVEGVGAHGCEYMTGGTAAILGPAGANLCAGMTGGRVYLWDPTGTRIGVARSEVGDRHATWRVRRLHASRRGRASGRVPCPARGASRRRFAARAQPARPQGACSATRSG